MVSSRLANRLGVTGAPRRRPVTDAREVLNARAGRTAAASSLAARRLGVASRGIVKMGGRPARGGLRLNTMRSDLVAGGSGLRSDTILAAGRRNFAAQTQGSPRFQTRNLRQPAQTFGAGMANRRRGLISGTKRLAAMQQIQAAHMDIDERERGNEVSRSPEVLVALRRLLTQIPLARNKRIQVNPNGISVTTANPFMSSRQGLFGGRASALEEDDDLERLTLDDVLGRSPLGAATAAAAAAAAAARLYHTGTASIGRTPRATSSLSRIQHRLDGGGLGSPARRSPSDPLPGCSVLVANLHPQVTESDIRDLFQDIGPMHDARMVAVGTALATFHRQSDAMKAFKAYNGRMLDGQPMNLTVLTLDILQSNQR
ncbi:polymerase delta-interacting protein 3-like isoform X1 [Dermacentor albipictus]|uniref:polymerase delta-interacting protein 3-like isoform X1 n=1 Tax=Dermacentor albipictus TaxID=60249 RepID=UPI0038FC87D1